MSTAPRRLIATLIAFTVLLLHGDVSAQYRGGDLAVHLTFRGGFSARTQEAAARETARIWRPYGVDVTLGAADAPGDHILDVPVFVMRDADGDVASTALASVRFTDGEPEPIVFVYNKRRMPPEDVPQSHAALERLLRTRASAYRDKVATYNPERSGTGFLYLTQDLRASRDTWALVRAMGRTRLRLYTSTGAMMERVASGEHVLAYNVIGSYAFERQSLDPSLAVTVRFGALSPLLIMPRLP